MQPGPPSTGIAEAFLRAVARGPDACAVSSALDRLSYSELDRWTDALCARLQTLGVVPGDRVALVLERSIELVVCELAVLKAGAAYVPLDTSLPPARTALLLSETAPAAVIAGPLARLPEDRGGWRSLDVVADVQALRRSGAQRRPVVGAPEDLAYVMYTSGSTGVPKGVAVPHRGVLRLVIDPDYVELSPSEIVLGFAPASFDAATFEVWGALLNGARLHLAPPGPIDLDALAETIQQGGVTTAWLTAALFNEVVDAQLERLGGIHQLLAGGDVLSAGHARRLLERWPSCRLINGYGPTENTTFTCCHAIRPEDLSRQSLPIGRPIRGTEVFVVDERLEAVPPGEWGELCAGGAGVALGYWKRDDLTRERFVHLRVDGRTVRVYRTGDRVRRGLDGVIEFGGRFDRQVKIRGYRIEPGEIEACLRRQAGVREAVVEARDGPRGDKRLVAYVQLDQSAPDALPGVMEAVRSELPVYLVPAAWVPITQWPVNLNGKIDRAALPNPEWSRPDALGPVPALTPREAALGDIWRDLLRVSAVAPSDDFFALGGDSLLAMRLVARVQTTLGSRLRYEHLFEHRTLREQAAALSADVSRAGEAAPLVAELPGVLPASFAQARMWFAQEVAPAEPLYNVVMTVEARGALDLAALRLALAALIAGHESLRTRYREEDGAPVQEVMDDCPVPLEIRSAGSPDNWPADTAAAARRILDLRAGPPWSVTALRAGPKRTLLVFVFHHIAVDGWSMALLWDDLSRLYRDAVTTGTARLSAPPVHYRQFSWWQRATVESGEYDTQLAYWRSTLSGLAPLEMPADHPRSSALYCKGDRFSVAVPPPLAGELRRLGQAWGATPFVTLLAGLVVALARRGAGADIAVGTMVAGRTRPELESLVGLFVNTLVLRVQVGALKTIRDLVLEIRRVVATAFDNQDVPFDSVVKALAPERHPGRHPLCQVMFVLQNTPRAQLNLVGVETTPPDELGTGTAKLDLLLSLDPEADGGYRGYFEYRTDLYTRATAEALVRDFLGALQQMAGAGDTPLEVLGVPLGAPRGVPSLSQLGPSVPVAPAETEGIAWLTERLCRVFDEVLDRPEGVQPDADFFALGGHSLLASRLAHLIRERLKIRIRIGDILLFPTPRAMAQFISLPRAASTNDLLIELRGGGDLPPLAFVHGDYWADGVYCRDLAAGLAPRQPFFVMGYPPLPADGWPASIEGLARAYADDLVRRFGDGPLRIGGFCNGAAIAFETARLLRRRGVTLDRVVLVDPAAENLRFGALRPLIRGMRRGLAEPLAVALSAKLFSLLDLLHPRSRGRRRDLRSRIAGRLRSRATREEEEIKPGRPEGLIVDKAAEAVDARLQRAVAAYQPTHLGIPIDLILASDFDVAETVRLWREVTTGVRWVISRYPHLELLRGDLPDLLRAVLIDARFDGRDGAA